VAETRRDDVRDAGRVKPRGLVPGSIPGDPIEGSSQARVGAGVRDSEAEEFDQEAVMDRLEAGRGEQGVGMPIEGVHMGTPAGAASDSLRNREEVPVREKNEGQSKDRNGNNTRRTP